MTKELLNLYELRKDRIKQRLKDFEEVFNKDDKKIFAELCFCLLTPQSKARICDIAILDLVKSNVLFTGNQEDIVKYLKNVRFENNKAKYILEARNFFTKNNNLLIKEKLNGNAFELREFLVKNIKGLGYKESGHFLRNVGFKNLAILDRHILKNLKELNIIKEIPKTLTRKKYLEIEEKMKAYSDKIKIPIDELDLLLWSKETGEIFK